MTYHGTNPYILIEWEARNGHNGFFTDDYREASSFRQRVALATDEYPRLHHCTREQALYCLEHVEETSFDRVTFRAKGRQWQAERGGERPW